MENFTAQFLTLKFKSQNCRDHFPRCQNFRAKFNEKVETKKPPAGANAARKQFSKPAIFKNKNAPTKVKTPIKIRRVAEVSHFLSRSTRALRFWISAISARSFSIFSNESFAGNFANFFKKAKFPAAENYFAARPFPRRAPFARPRRQFLPVRASARKPGQSGLPSPRPVPGPFPFGPVPSRFGIFLKKIKKLFEISRLIFCRDIFFKMRYFPF